MRQTARGPDGPTTKVAPDMDKHLKDLHDVKHECYYNVVIFAASGQCLLVSELITMADRLHRDTVDIPIVVELSV